MGTIDFIFIGGPLAGQKHSAVGATIKKERMRAGIYHNLPEFTGF
jgi:hypothetical protein